MNDVTHARTDLVPTELDGRILPQVRDIPFPSLPFPSLPFPIPTPNILYIFRFQYTHSLNIPTLPRMFPSHRHKEAHAFLNTMRGVVTAAHKEARRTHSLNDVLEFLGSTLTVEPGARQSAQMLVR